MVGICTCAGFAYLATPLAPVRLLASMHTRMDRQSRPLDELFPTARVVANMWPDAAMNALCFRVRKTGKEGREAAERVGAHRDGQDRYVSRMASRMCCKDTVSRAAGPGQQLADKLLAKCQASGLVASREEAWARAPCWHSARTARQLRPWQSGKGRTRSSDRNSATALSRAAMAVCPSGVAGGVVRSGAGAGAGARGRRPAVVDVDRARL